MKINKILVLIPAVFLITSCSILFPSNDNNQNPPTTNEYTTSYISPHNAKPQDAQNQSTNLEQNWWRNSAFYHIWVKSFYNSDGKYCGDLKGITQKLDYIQNTVGCDAIWLSPIFKCQSNDTSESGNMHGYDTVDYYTINSYFGTENDLIELINACHQRNMKIIFDFVPNHTATNNQWFQNSKASKTVNGVDYSSWYIWNDTKQTINNGMKSSDDSWHSGGTGAQKKYYYGCFSSTMPDLNYKNPQVREEMKNVARYWLNKGFDGLRLDGARYLCEDGTTGCDAPSTHQFYKELRAELDKYTSPKFMVCEAWLENDRPTLDAYLGNGTEFNMAFDFDQGKACTLTVFSGTDKTGDTIRKNPSSTMSYGTFLGNHDEYTVTCGGKNYIRFGSALNQDDLLIRQTIALSLMRPTVPFIYYGNEFGQKEYGTGGDMRARGPMNWSPTQGQIQTTKLNKALLNLRKDYSTLFQEGSVQKLKTSTSSVMAYTIKLNTQKLLCIYNLSDNSASTVTLTDQEQNSSSKIILGGGNNNTQLNFNSKTITATNLGPRAIRIYLLNASTTKTPYYTAEESSNSTHQTTTPSKFTTVSLMGTLSDWSNGKQMIQSTLQNQIIWSTQVSLTSGKTYLFKFRGDSNYWIGANQLTLPSTASDEGTSDHNIIFSPSTTGSYTFTYNETASSCSIQKE